MLDLRGIVKSYGAVRALDGVDFTAERGEIVGITGDNGAGKSTLLKTIAGAIQPDGGQLCLDGVPVRFDSPADARRQGVEIVYQNLALAPDLDVVQNAFLGRELTRGPLRTLDRAQMEAEVRRHLAELEIEIDALSRPIAAFSGGQRQAVAIARSMLSNPKVIALDEPTAALSAAKIPAVLDLLRRLRAKGAAVLIVTHRVQDLLEVSDRVVVVGAGRVVLDEPPSTLSLSDVINAINDSAGGSR